MLVPKHKNMKENRKLRNRPDINILFNCEQIMVAFQIWGRKKERVSINRSRLFRK